MNKLIIIGSIIANVFTITYCSVIKTEQSTLVGILIGASLVGLLYNVMSLFEKE